MAKYSYTQRYCPEQSKNVIYSTTWRHVGYSNSHPSGSMGPVIPINSNHPTSHHRGPIVTRPVPIPAHVIINPYCDYDLHDVVDDVVHDAEHIANDAGHVVDDAGHTAARVAKTTVAAPVHFLRSAAERVTGDSSHPAGRHHLSDHLTQGHPRDTPSMSCR